MATKPNRALKYGDQPIRITTVQVIEKLGGAATIKQVDAYLRGLYPHYRDNTRSNLVINTVNCNRSHWPCNEVARRTDDTAHRYHEYDRLFKRGNIFEIYQLKWFTEFGHLNRGDMLTSEQHRCHNEKKKFQRRV